jgi:uncharacterized protein (DUF486 family)
MKLFTVLFMGFALQLASAKAEAATMTVGQLKTMVAAIPAAMPNSAPVYFQQANMSEEQMQNKMIIQGEDLEQWDSASGIQYNVVQPNKLLFKRE